MPYYDYSCVECAHNFTEWHSILDHDDNTFCPVCEGLDVRRLFTAPAVSFKGSGWGKDG